MDLNINNISSNLRESIKNYEAKADIYNFGVVTEAGDGIVQIKGLHGCKYGELLKFGEEDYGIALNLVEEDGVGAVLLDEGIEVKEGTKVRSTGNVVEVPVGEALLGRVVNPLGIAIDGKGAIKTNKTRPIEAESAGILDRKPVKQPLQTGIVAIDSMVPIGRGQRELIIGDRQTGKTAIAIDTILNQKNSGVICIYVAIGQKASTVAQITRTLEETGAMKYTVIVSSTASDAAPMQYIAPYAGCAMAEEFMYNGKDVLIVYDDLSKHAVAYRAMSLLLRRPPGREAYPGDVFYLHSRLLERAARLSDELGGGSITALPIIETMAGDISAYIPTNVISITDGQVFLESELFFSGVRPAVNVGLSVSRVGGSAQTKAMRRVSGKLRIDMAQYRELAVFAQFGSELDASTKQLLEQGERLTESLKQGQYHPLPMEEQVVFLQMITNKALIDLPLHYVAEFNSGYLEFIRNNYPKILSDIRDTGDLSDDNIQKLISATEEFKKSFKELNGIQDGKND